MVRKLVNHDEYDGLERLCYHVRRRNGPATQRQEDKKTPIQFEEEEEKKKKKKQHLPILAGV